MTSDQYTDLLDALKLMLCDYINASKNCDTKLGKSICPMGGTPAGGKLFKVRLGLPGRGKSGALRLAVATYCDDERVKVLAAWERKDDPSKAEVKAAGVGH